MMYRIRPQPVQAWQFISGGGGSGPPPPDWLPLNAVYDHILTVNLGGGQLGLVLDRNWVLLRDDGYVDVLTPEEFAAQVESAVVAAPPVAGFVPPPKPWVAIDHAYGYATGEDYVMFRGAGGGTVYVCPASAWVEASK